MTATRERIERIADEQFRQMIASSEFLQDSLRLFEPEIVRCINSALTALCEEMEREVGDSKEARLLMGLIRIAANDESSQTEWKVTIEYDNEQDGALVKNGDGEVIGECYDLDGAEDMDPEKHCEWQMLQAIDRAIKQTLPQPPAT